MSRNDEVTMPICLGDYDHSLLTFKPRLEDMRLTETPQARIRTHILHSGEVTSAHCTTTIQMAGGQSNSVSVRASQTGGGATFENNRVQIDSAIELTGQQSSLEEDNTILYDGSISRTRTLNTEDRIEIKREIRLNSRYRQQKQIEELTVGRLFVSAYNTANGTGYLVANADDDTDHDLVIKQADGSVVLKIQVVKGSDGRVWGALANQGQYHDVLHEQAAIKEVMDVIKKKAAHYAEKSTLVLLLDGGWSAFTEKVIRKVQREYSTILKQTGFLEIWYASRVSDVTIRLFP